eukprot:1789581-Prymnesium_polylepis.1
MAKRRRRERPNAPRNEIPEKMRSASTANAPTSADWWLRAAHQAWRADDVHVERRCQWKRTWARTQTDAHEAWWPARAVLPAAWDTMGVQRHRRGDVRGRARRGQRARRTAETPDCPMKSITRMTGGPRRGMRDSNSSSASGPPSGRELLSWCQRTSETKPAKTIHPTASAHSAQRSRSNSNSSRPKLTRKTVL